MAYGRVCDGVKLRTRTDTFWWEAIVAANAPREHCAVLVRALLTRGGLGNVAVLASLRLAPCWGGATVVTDVCALAAIVMWICKWGFFSQVVAFRSAHRIRETGSAVFVYFGGAVFPVPEVPSRRVTCTFVAFIKTHRRLLASTMIFRARTTLLVRRARRRF